MKSIKSEMDFNIKKGIMGSAFTILGNVKKNYILNFGVDFGMSIRQNVRYKVWSNIGNGIGMVITRGFKQNKFNLK